MSGGLARAGFKRPCNWALPDFVPRAVTNSSPETTNPETLVRAHESLSDGLYRVRVLMRNVCLFVTALLYVLLRCGFRQGALLQLLFASGEKNPSVLVYALGPHCDDEITVWLWWGSGGLDRIQIGSGRSLAVGGFSFRVGGGWYDTLSR